MKLPLRSLEIFTGAGGLAIATHEAGFHHEAVVEWNKDACETLRDNSESCSALESRKWKVIEGDIRNVDATCFEGVDLVAGGPPCQPFSIGGKHKGRDDGRDMIPEFIRCVRQSRPRAFIMENVKGLTRQSFKTYFAYTILQLTYPEVTRKSGEKWTTHLNRLEDIHTVGGTQGLAYNVVYRVLNSADYGVPQTRERVFVVGFRSDVKISWHFPAASHSQEALFADKWVTGHYWHRIKRPETPPSLRNKAVQRRDLFQNQLSAWETVRGAIADLPTATEKEHMRVLNHRLQLGARSYPGHTGSSIDWPAKTLKAGGHGVPGGENMILFPDGSVRYFTVREAARIQTFPDAWRFKGAWSEAMRQLGNAVPVKLAKTVAESVAATLLAHE